MNHKPIKAYKNLEFLHSGDARTIRVLCELIEPKARLAKHNIEHTVVFFGSARAKSKLIAEKYFAEMEKLYEKSGKSSARLIKDYEHAKADLYMSQFYEKAHDLSYKLTKWTNRTPKNRSKLVICTGGGGGIMEAVNKGSCEAGGDSIGFNISLPMEQRVNEFVCSDLAFEFHYFFIRKFWFAYMAKALVVFPGGFGTLDEMTEMLTLIQTGKIMKKLPIILFGSEYWKKIINFQEMIRLNTISEKDLKLIKFSDDVDETLEYLKKNLNKYVL